MKTLITVIGRGHSGTRAISHTLYASGVYMGNRLNPSGDKIPGQAMYDACRAMARYVEWNGGLSWDFDALFSMPIDPDFERHIGTYLEDVLHNPAAHRGWKIPETSLVYPWIGNYILDFAGTVPYFWCVIRKGIAHHVEKAPESPRPILPIRCLADRAV